MPDEDDALESKRGIPMPWLVAGLWAVTMALAAGWGHNMEGSVSSLAQSAMERNERLAGIEQRVVSLERANEQAVHAPEMGDVKARLDRIERKLDDVLRSETTERRPR